MLQKYLPLLALLFLTASPSVLAAQNRVQNRPKIEICQQKISQIRNRFQKIIDLSANQITDFDQKVQRVENYYFQNLLPSGKTVSNYGNLISQIESQKKIVESSLSKAKAEADNFDCNRQPQTSVRNFRLHIQDTSQALKNYRIAVKNLIVAVRAQTSAD